MDNKLNTKELTATIFLGGLIGGVIGYGVLKKHFVKADMA